MVHTKRETDIQYIDQNMLSMHQRTSDLEARAQPKFFQNLPIDVAAANALKNKV